MKAAHRHHDISDHVWNLLEPYLPGRQGVWVRTGASWRDLSANYGDWKNTHRGFCRCRDKGIWESLLEKLVNDADFEWLMSDAPHIKVHPRIWCNR